MINIIMSRTPCSLHKPAIAIIFSTISFGKCDDARLFSSIWIIAVSWGVIRNASPDVMYQQIFVGSREGYKFASAHLEKGIKLAPVDPISNEVADDEITTFRSARSDISALSTFRYPYLSSKSSIFIASRFFPQENGTESLYLLQVWSLTEREV